MELPDRLRERGPCSLPNAGNGCGPRRTGTRTSTTGAASSPTPLTETPSPYRAGPSCTGRERTEGRAGAWRRPVRQTTVRSLLMRFACTSGTTSCRSSCPASRGCPFRGTIGSAGSFQVKLIERCANPDTGSLEPAAISIRTPSRSRAQGPRTGTSVAG